MDLYQRLGIKRGASDAEVKKAYRSLAKQLHPDRNRDNPKAAERFATVTAAYDLLADKDKRARYDRGELDEEGNPKMPFGGVGGGFGGTRPGGGGQGGFDGFPGGSPGGFEGAGGAADLSDLFEGLFGGGGAPGGRRQQGGGFGGRARPAPKGADVAYRLQVPFVDAALLNDQRVTLASGRTIDLKLPKGVEEGTRIRLAGQGEAGSGGAGDAIVTIAIAPHPFFIREGNDIRLNLPVTLGEAVLGGKVKVPTPEGPVMLTVPRGSSSGKVLRLKGRGFTDKAGKRGDLLVSLAVDLPAGDEALERFAAEWFAGGNPRAALGV